MLIGAIDPLEGSFIILPGSGMVALGALLDRSRHRRLLYRAFILIAIGVGALFALSMLGGVGVDTGRSMWWLLVALPYPVGWIMSLLGGILRLIESFRRPAQSRQQVQREEYCEPERGADAASRADHACR